MFVGVPQFGSINYWSLPEKKHLGPVNFFWAPASRTEKDSFSWDTETVGGPKSRTRKLVATSKKYMNKWNPQLIWILHAIPKRKSAVGHQRLWGVMEPVGKAQVGRVSSHWSVLGRVCLSVRQACGKASYTVYPYILISWMILMKTLTNVN